jgi:hypothetical protein
LIIEGLVVSTLAYVDEKQRYPGETDERQAD